VLGVGHKLVDLAVAQARNSASSVTLVSRKTLKHPLVVFRIRDRVTSVAGAVRAVSVGCLVSDDYSCQIQRDWELLKLLNGILADRNFRRSISSGSQVDTRLVQSTLDTASSAVEEQLGTLDLPFKVPDLSVLALVWPTDFSKPDASSDEE